MPVLEAGSRAPEISLKLMNSPQYFSLNDARKRGPVLAVFFKINCPTCQFTFPFIQRIYAAYGNDKVSIVGVSQDNPTDSAAFVKKFGLTFPIALEEMGSYPASNAYGLNYVPTLLWISPPGNIENSIVGWDKKEMQRLNQQVARAAGKPLAEVFEPVENVPDFKAG